VPPEAPQPPILPPRDGFLLLDREHFHHAFAGDVDADLAEFMADSQLPWGLKPQAERSPSPHGEASQAGTSSRPKIG
jgi:hypothetical protein